jgi:hypothetical protein
MNNCKESPDGLPQDVEESTIFPKMVNQSTVILRRRKQKADEERKKDQTTEDSEETYLPGRGKVS